MYFILKNLVFIEGPGGERITYLKYLQCWFIAKKDAGKGEVAFFDSRKEAVKWVASWENIDKDLWDINYIKVEV